MNDAEVYFKLYGKAIWTVPFYFDHFSILGFGVEGNAEYQMKVVR